MTQVPEDDHQLHPRPQQGSSRRSQPLGFTNWRVLTPPHLAPRCHKAGSISRLPRGTERGLHDEAPPTPSSLVGHRQTLGVAGSTQGSGEP